MTDADIFRAAVTRCAVYGVDPEYARVISDSGFATVALVEGLSDRLAVETLAVRQGRNLAVERVCVVEMGGAMSIRRFLGVFEETVPGMSLRGMCDVGEERVFAEGLGVDHHPTGSTRAALEKLGFHVCVSDLEDELIRCLGVASVERVLAAEGDLARFRTFQNQPAQRGRETEPQIRRFIGSIGGRKARYARQLVLSLDLDDLPLPLEGLVADL